MIRSSYVFVLLILFTPMVTLFSFPANAQSYDITFTYGGGYYSFEVGNIDLGQGSGHGFLGPGTGNSARFDFWLAPDGERDGFGGVGPDDDGGGGASINETEFGVPGGNDIFLGSLIVTEDGIDDYQGGTGIDIDSFATAANPTVGQYTGPLTPGTIAYARVFETSTPNVGSWYYVGQNEILRDVEIGGTPPNSVQIGRSLGVFGLDPIDGTAYSYQLGPSTTTTSTTTTSTSTATTFAVLLPVTDGLVGYWPGDHMTAEDFSGSGNHGNFVGDATTTTNIAPCVAPSQTNAFEFDGMDDWISIPEMNFPSGTDPELTISFWVNLRDGSEEYFVSLGTRVPGGSIEIGRRDQGHGGIAFTSHSSADANWNAHATKLPLNRWIHYAYTASNGTDRVYTNGTFSDLQTNIVTYTPVYTGNSKLGSDAGAPPSTFLDGFLDEIAIYDRVLSATEIQLLFEGPNPTTTTTTTSSTTTTSTLPPPLIVNIDTGVKMWAIYAPTGMITPEYSTNLLTSPVEWIPISNFSNTIENGTNAIEFDPPDTNASGIFFRLLRIAE